MTRVHTDDFSPSQIGVQSTRMSAAMMRSNRAGHSSVSQPCSVMSGCTPVAMSWSTARIVSTATPRSRMICWDRLARPSVFDTSGERLSVQLTNTARRSLWSTGQSSVVSMPEPSPGWTACYSKFTPGWTTTQRGSPW